MKTYILHANQEITLKSRGGHWPVETLRSKPTFCIEASSLAQAHRKACAEVRARYEQNPDVQVVGLHIGVALHREIKA